MKLNPIVEEAREYPFAKLMEIKRQREAAGHRVLDFSMGDPREPTPPFLRDAMKNAVPEISSYPSVKGSPKLRDSRRVKAMSTFALEERPCSIPFFVTPFKYGTCWS